MNLRFLISLFSLLVSSCIVLGQNSQLEPLPIDPNVRYGVLPNGLTYYIRHNALPKDRADFYIAQKVGSILEEDSQRGLAHFLEHMAFNGTKNYPGKSLLNYLESIGVKFGANLNAYTSIDETVYNITGVPVREGTIDSCLLILHDWSCAISLEEKEIDSERGVISEEWRTSRGADMRMLENLTPQIYAGSQYADRFPIGKLEVIQNFPYQAIRDYYKKWYRPDQQAIIVVGDIDVDQVEAKIKSLFGSIPMPANAAKREYYPVPDNKEPIIAVATDKEATNTQIMLFFKHEPVSDSVKASAQGFVYQFVKSMAASMINSRFSEIIKKPNAPFLSAGVDDSEFFLSKTKDAFSGYITCKEGEVSKALIAFLDEIYRVDQHGFTETEYQRAVIDYTEWLTNFYNERNKQQSSLYTREYIDHFTNGGSISGIETEYRLFQQISKMVTLQMINGYVKQQIKDDNIALVVMGPEKEGLIYPDKAELLTILTESGKKEQTAYEDKVSNEPLLSQQPVAGKVVKESTDKKFDATVWKLSNGATVVVKPTNFKDDEIIMSAGSPGGTSQFTNPQDITNNKLINAIVPLGGYGNFDAIALSKALTGKQVSVSTSISSSKEAINASSNKRDIETMLQLLYLKATSPRQDIDAYNAFIERNKEGLKNRDLNPSAAFSDTVMAIVYNNDPRVQALKKEDLDKIDYARIIEMYKNRYADFSDFTFTFVGNVNPDTLKPLVEKYIASLPTLKRTEKGEELGAVMPGKRAKQFNRPMETPKSSVYVVYSGKEKYSYEKAIQLDMLASILRIVYVKTIREEEGGTYGVGVSDGFVGTTNHCILRFSFDTNANQEQKLKELAKSEFEKLAKNGPSQEDFNKVKENMIKVYDEYIKLNGWWLSSISSFYTDGVDRSHYMELVKKQTPETIRKFAEKFLKQNNEIEVIMTGTQK